MGRLFVLVLLVLAAPASAEAARLVPIREFRQPVYVAARGDGVVVVERRGRIRDLRGRVVADLRSRVVRFAPDETVDQRGMLSVAYGRGRFYAYYVDRAGRLVVDEFPGGRRVLDLGPAALQHHGGQVQFGPDALLYVSTGIGDDPESSGHILRLRPGGAPEVYATGLRNPWRFSFHRRTLLIGDVGESQLEEVNVLAPGAPAGTDFRSTPPALVRRHGSRVCAITGGYVVKGRYVYGDLCSGQVRSARLRGTRLVDDRSLRLTVPYLVSFGQDRAGRLYAASFLGTVYRIVT